MQSNLRRLSEFSDERLYLFSNSLKKFLKIIDYLLISIREWYEKRITDFPKSERR